MYKNRINFKFSSALLKYNAFQVKLPPFGQVSEFKSLLS